MSPEVEGPSAAAAESAAESAAEEPGTGARRRVENVRRSVLIVEDDPAQRAMLLELISLWGYRTVAVGSAEEAEALLEQAGALDIAVVDVFLPGESGVQLITRLRERFPDSVLIGISALSTAARRRSTSVGPMQNRGPAASTCRGRPVTLRGLKAVCLRVAQGQFDIMNVEGLVPGTRRQRIRRAQPCVPIRWTCASGSPRRWTTAGGRNGRSPGCSASASRSSPGS